MPVKGSSPVASLGLFSRHIESHVWSMEKYHPLSARQQASGPVVV